MKSTSRWSRSFESFCAAAILSGTLTFSGLASAQDTGAEQEAEPSGPSIEDSVKFINDQLADSSSGWNPCLETTSLTLSEDGQLIFESTRESYCEHSRQIAHLRDLDPNAIEVLNEQEMVVRVSCVEGGECGRYWEKRKEWEAEKWTLRDKEWRPESQYQGRPHKLTGLELRLSSNERSANRVAEGLAYMLKTAKTQDAFADPLPFGTPKPVEAETTGEGG